MRSDLRALASADAYTQMPGDWYVVMSDVRDSTVAIESGSYKNVNTCGAATIAAVLNAAGPVEIPFVFEGDGSMLCVPESLSDAARAALLQTQEMARKSFGLDLRVGAIRVADIERAGFAVYVARYRVSENYVQAVFAGGGMAYADRTMKDPATAEACAVRPGAVQASGRFDGLECRWQDIPSPRGETVSVIVRTLATDPDQARAAYLQVLMKVAEIYGDDEDSHPITSEGLELTLDPGKLGAEVGVRASGRGPLGRWAYLAWIRLVTRLGAFAMKHGIRAGTDWGRYKATVVRNADVRKFNDVYRQILAGTPAQREQLTAWLDERFARRELVYGLHVTDRAQMTCLVFDYSGRHIHFVDGADGGLFLASREFKRRTRELAPPTP